MLRRSIVAGLAALTDAAPPDARPTRGTSRSDKASGPVTSMEPLQLWGGSLFSPLLTSRHALAARRAWVGRGCVCFGLGVSSGGDWPRSGATDWRGAER